MKEVRLLTIIVSFSFGCAAPDSEAICAKQAECGTLDRSEQECREVWDLVRLLGEEDFSAGCRDCVEGTTCEEQESCASVCSPDE